MFSLGKCRDARASRLAEGAIENVRFRLFSCAVCAILLASSALAGTILLKAGTIDTNTVSGASFRQPKNGSGCYLVQLNGPVTESAKAALRAAGAELLDYIPENAFLARIPHASVAEVKHLACVNWIGPFAPEHKQSPELRRFSGKSQYLVSLLPGSDTRFAVEKAKRLGAKTLTCKSDAHGSVCRILADSSRLADLAAISSVAWIEPYIQPVLLNDAASGICGIPETRQNLSLFGATQLIGVADSGLDTGNIPTLSADFANRVTKTYTLRRPGDWSDQNGHGTHVIGTILGSGVLSGSSPSTHTYTGSFAGYAPEARLVLQSIGDTGDYVYPPLHLADLFQPVYSDGVRIHNNSWGSAVNGQYTVYCNEVDRFCWDHKDFCVTFAAGNQAIDADRNGVVETGNVCAPASAKNCIAAGATENLRLSGGYQLGYGIAWPNDYPAAPIKFDLMSNNPSGMAAFSSRGPTADGRIKPDLCAPGTNVISCRSHTPTADTGWAIYNSNYIYWGGTSMSAPQVCGAAALAREYYQTVKGINPSAALIKATLINGAIDISPGQYGTGLARECYPVPDNSQGWGRLNVKQSLCPDPPTVSEFADETAALATGDYRDYYYTVVNNTVPLKVTLVWTDYPGSVLAAKELVNDLDLTVVSPTGASQPFAPNRTDNVEQVTIAVPEMGTYRVRVSAYNVPMGPQDYALVVTGGLPDTYIAGQVTSTSGAPVQGATITFVWSGGSKRVTTNSSGRYISRVGNGTYSVQVSKTGWSFSPRAQMVHVTGTPRENINFQGSGAPGGLVGTISKAIGGVVSYIVESSHPYLNNTDQIYTITAHEAATRVRVHFAEIDLINDGDVVYVEDANGRVINTFTGTSNGEDFWSSWVNGSTVNIHLVTNSAGNTAYGFYIDGYETDLINQGGLGGATVTLTPGNYTAVSSPDGSYSFSNVPPGVYTVTPSLAHWKFEPVSRSVDVPAVETASGVDFQGFPPGAITGEVLAAGSSIVGINVQSAHPYDDNIDEMWTIDGGPTATRIRVHFARIDTEPGFDWVWVLDAEDNMIESYTGPEADIWSPWVNGRIAKIELTSDYGNTGWGFAIDKYEIQAVGGGIAGIDVHLAPDSRTVTTGPDGIFSIPDVDVGVHTVTPSSALWNFDPASAFVVVSAGTGRHVTFYATAAELTSPAAAKTLADGTQVTLTNLLVSAIYNGCFYAQDRDRVSGIRVNSSTATSVGDVVDITGTLATESGERCIINPTVTKH